MTRPKINNITLSTKDNNVPPEIITDADGDGSRQRYVK